MTKARVTFWQRTGAMRAAIDDYELQDLPLLAKNASRNASVRVIRNGLAVQCFNILEDFIKARTSEALTEISISGVQFSWLPDALREAATLGAVKAIGVQAKRRLKPDQIVYTQTYSAQIASTQTGALQLPDIGFFHIASNIGADNLRDALIAFGVHKPWEQLSGLLSRMSISALPAENVFSSLAERRHSAAHNPNTSISESDLVQSIVDAIGIGVGFDLLLTSASRSLRQLTAPTLGGKYLLGSHSTVALRFIRAHGPEFREIKEGGKRGVARSADWKLLLPDAEKRAHARDEALIVQGTTLPAIYWCY